MSREISQKQTDKYHMNPLLWGIEKSQAHGIKNRIVVARNWGRVAWSTRVLLINRHFQMKSSTAKSINKKCHSHQRFLASKCEWGLPKLNPADAAHPPWWSTRHGDPPAMVIHPPWWLLRSWENTRGSHLPQLPLLKVNKETGFGPDSWGTYESNEFSEPRGLNLPIYPMLNSLIWYLIFDVQTACSLCSKFVCSLIPTAMFQGEHFSQSYWDAVSWAWSPKLSHQIK